MSLIRAITFYRQVAAGRDLNIAAMVAEARCPYAHLGVEWAGLSRRMVDRHAADIARASNQDLSDEELIGLLFDCFHDYCMVAIVACGPNSIAARWWRAYANWTLDHYQDIGELLAKEGLLFLSGYALVIRCDT